MATELTTDNELTNAKKAFALAMMDRPEKAFDVAFALFPSNTDTGLALKAASEWPKDPEVIAFQRQAIADPQAAGVLLDREQAAREILERARNCRDDETYGKLMRLYADVRGFIKQGEANTTNNTVNVTKVIMMPAPQSKEDWSRNATAQQRNLVIEGEKIARNQ